MLQTRTLELANDGPKKCMEAVLDGSAEPLNGSSDEVFRTPIRSLNLSKNERHLFVGTDGGELRILAHDSEYLRLRLQRKLAEIGIL